MSAIMSPSNKLGPLFLLFFRPFSQSRNGFGEIFLPKKYFTDNIEAILDQKLQNKNENRDERTFVRAPHFADEFV